MIESNIERHKRCCMNCSIGESIGISTCQIGKGIEIDRSETACGEHLGKAEAVVVWYDSGKTSCIVSGKHRVVFTTNGTTEKFMVSDDGVKWEKGIGFVVNERIMKTLDCTHVEVLGEFNRLLFLLGYEFYYG